MQLTAKNEMTSKEDQFQLSLLAAMGNTQRKEAADPLASKLNKVHDRARRNLTVQTKVEHATSFVVSYVLSVIYVIVWI